MCVCACPVAAANCMREYKLKSTACINKRAFLGALAHKRHNNSIRGSIFLFYVSRFIFIPRVRAASTAHANQSMHQQHTAQHIGSQLYICSTNSLQIWLKECTYCELCPANYSKWECKVRWHFAENRIGMEAMLVVQVDTAPPSIRLWLFFGVFQLFSTFGLFGMLLKADFQ